MNETLLGCPHCGKPVGFAPSMAGQVVACPHCRGQFQMPDKPPGNPPPVPRSKATRPDDGSLSFGDEDPSAPTGPRVRAELDSYRAAGTLATIVALGGSVLFLAGAILAVLTVIVPLWRGESPFLSQAQGLLWIVVVFLFAFLGIATLFCGRACVLIGVDAARTLRALERDAAAGPKTK